MTRSESDPIVRIERELKRLCRADMLGAMQPGVAYLDFRQAIGCLNLPTDLGLESLYSWRNGVSQDAHLTIGELDFFNGYHLMSIQTAVTNYKAFVGDRRWNPHWLPFLADGGGDFYVVELGGNSHGAVRHFRIDEEEHPIEFRSIMAMLETAAQAYEQGIFTLDPDGYLQTDWARLVQLAARLNTDVEWWEKDASE